MRRLPTDTRHGHAPSPDPAQTAWGDADAQVPEETAPDATAPGNQLFATAGAAATADPYRDGRSGSPSGSAQLPGVLAGYAVRPPWQVAGIDYHVGIPAGTVLKDPTLAGALPPGATYSATAHTVTVAANGVTLDAYDFSLHGGIRLVVTAADVTVRNCLFVTGANQGAQGTVVAVTPAAGNVTFLNNEFSGANIPVTSQAGNLLYVQNHGTAAFLYNHIHDTGGDAIDFSGGPQAEIVDYNLFANIGTRTAHADTLQWYNAQVTSGEIAFNTVYQSAPQPGPGNGALTLTSEGPAATMSDMVVSNDTILQVAAGTGNFATGFYADLGGVADHVAIRDLFIDPTGSLGFTGLWVLPTAYYGYAFARPTAITGVTDMVTGATYTTLPSGRYPVAPDVNGYAPALSDVYGVSAGPASGTLHAGDTVTITLAMDMAYTVAGTPLLTLNDGGLARYTAGSGTATLSFAYTVAATDTQVAALAVTGTQLPTGAAITDSLGNNANLAGANAAFPGLAVQPVVAPTGVAFATAGGVAPIFNRTLLATNARIATLAPAGGIATDSFAYALGGADSAAFRIKVATNGSAVLQPATAGIVGAAGGTLCRLSVTATDTTLGVSAPATPLNVVVGSPGDDTIRLASLTAGLSPATPTFVFGLDGADTIDATGLTGPVWIDAGARAAARLTGGSGDNRYLFGKPADSLRATPQTITNFNADRDTIDLTSLGIPLDLAGNLGTGTLPAGSIGWTAAGGATTVYVNTGTAAETLAQANMKILLLGNVALAQANFLHG